MTIAAERDFSSAIDARISERLPQHSKVGKFPTFMAYGSNSAHEQFCSAIDARINKTIASALKVGKFPTSMAVTAIADSSAYFSQDSGVV
ncbi:hypothetical protein H6F98_31995 [Microcoleus sp. FACHB-SPT15]|uniref:hypothetical protein n=1 Tax=Microcoleus sp. FACHB-SPT15 TaxID=2692830 RepID=UPI0017851148|nr:hypothetical protein [Microcoleus sp. FACHB-SPT15]MBD1810037.1 hypothetical protein [Microcoleus sp. FACHB-SPT15]